jgi:hypothetical protein
LPVQGPPVGKTYGILMSAFEGFSITALTRAQSSQI